MSDAAISVKNGSVRRESMEIGGLRVSDVAFPASLVLPSHYHERACFAVVLSGGVEKSFRQRTHETPATSVVTMPPEERHVDHFARSGARLLVVEPDDPARELLRPCRALFTEINHQRNGGVLWLAWRLVRELEDPDDVSPLAVMGLTLEMLATTSRTEGERAMKRPPPPWLLRTRDYLHAHFRRSIQMQALAEEAGVHPVYLARAFRRHFGAAPSDYVRRLRLEWAATQLATSDLSLAEVAHRAGFADQSHFTRAFKAHTGLTPGQYAAEMQC